MGLNDCDWDVYKGAWVDVVLANSNLGCFARGLRGEPEFGPSVRRGRFVDESHYARKLEAFFGADCARDIRNIPDYDLFHRVILFSALGGKSDGI